MCAQELLILELQYFSTYWCSHWMIFFEKFGLILIILFPYSIAHVSCRFVQSFQLIHLWDVRMLRTLIWSTYSWRVFKVHKYFSRTLFLTQSKSTCLLDTKKVQRNRFLKIFTCKMQINQVQYAVHTMHTWVGDVRFLWKLLFQLMQIPTFDLLWIRSLWLEDNYTNPCILSNVLSIYFTIF